MNAGRDTDLLEFVERDAEEVAQAAQQVEPFDVGLGVDPMRTPRDAHAAASAHRGATRSPRYSGSSAPSKPLAPQAHQSAECPGDVDSCVARTLLREAISTNYHLDIKIIKRSDNRPFGLQLGLIPRIGQLEVSDITTDTAAQQLVADLQRDGLAATTTIRVLVPLNRVLDHGVRRGAYPAAVTHL